MDRILQGADASLTLYVVNGDGDPAAADAAPSVTFTDAAGTEVGTVDAATTDTVGTYTVAVPAAVTATLGAYQADATWTVAGADRRRWWEVETVGGFLFDIDDWLAFDGSIDRDRYTRHRLEQTRTVAEVRLERAAGVAFVRRGRRAVVNGSGERLLILPDVELATVDAVTVDGTALTVDELADLELQQWGGLVRPTGTLWDRGVANVVVTYQHGLVGPPAPVARAAMLLASDSLHAPPISPRATSQTTDVGTFRLTIAGRDGPTGHPEVDAVIEQFGRAQQAVG